MHQFNSGLLLCSHCGFKLVLTAGRSHYGCVTGQHVSNSSISWDSAHNKAIGEGLGGVKQSREREEWEKWSHLFSSLMLMVDWFQKLAYCLMYRLVLIGIVMAFHACCSCLYPTPCHVLNCLRSTYEQPVPEILSGVVESRLYRSRMSDIFNYIFKDFILILWLFGVYIYS